MISQRTVVADKRRPCGLDRLLKVASPLEVMQGRTEQVQPPDPPSKPLGAITYRT